MDRTVAAFRAGALAARVVPRPVGIRAAELGGRLAARRAIAAGADGPRFAGRHMARVLGRSLPDAEREALVRDVYAGYARYWYDSFRLPSRGRAEIDARFSFEGFGWIDEACRRGTGPILALPHLGGWEWAAFWLALVPRLPVTAVVEPLEPPAVFEWFAEFRRSLGMEIVPLGPEAASAVTAAIKAGHVTCLLCDRDLTGGGVEVEFFGERTTVPAGPAMLALRTGAPLLPVAVYVRGEGYHAVVRPPVDTRRVGRLRDDVARVSQALAHELELLVRAAPTQWHLLQPNWPSDRELVGGPVPA
ncbi:MAG: phosphatidylinositol mannoside acyltransferase [Acidimicrobiales bacterium]|nr:phosphatidylinositol mannoside acyltransferase [Acidimicrobiales bacterium]